MQHVLFDTNHVGSILDDPLHKSWLVKDAKRQLSFFGKSLRSDGGFDVLDWQGTALPRAPQELHTTTRLIHSFAMAKAAGAKACDDIIDAGMSYLWQTHRDTQHGGYKWSALPDGSGDSVKLAYGHVFVLLAASSAKQVGHADADRLLGDVMAAIDAHYWDEEFGLHKDEFNADWTPFSAYRGMNANMHGVEALLAAFEATGDDLFLKRAGRILEFFVGKIAPAHDWRLPEHFDENWNIDPDYAGNPMFRPHGSTPGHSFELGRLTLQHWELTGRQDDKAPARARRLIETAHANATQPKGGYAYTLDNSGKVAISDRYWWPVTEAIGAYAALIKANPTPSDVEVYKELWTFAASNLIDHEHGGWFAEVDAQNAPTQTQFQGKPDIYHALQADLLPITPGLANYFANAGSSLV